MRVRIYKPAKSAMQSGRGRTRYGGWRLEPETVTPRMPEPLMGWLSSGDTFGELRDRYRFRTAEEAVAFAKRNGWDYVVEQHEERRIVPRNYLDNFRIVRPLDEEKQASTGVSTQGEAPKTQH